MKAAPGAQLSVNDIFGRDAFIANMWRALDGNSVRMEAERRIGKTSILHKMEAEPPVGWEPVSLDLEQVHSAAEFAERICEKVHERLTGWKKQGRRFWGILESLAGTQLHSIKFPEKKNRPDGYWKTLLTGAVEDLVEQQLAAGKRVVFLFDEMPWMLSAIADPTRAIELDTTNTHAFNNKSWALNALGRHTDALEACDRAIEIAPNYIHAWNSKGWALNALHRHAEALEACNRAIEIDPNYIHAWNNKAWALNALGRQAEAMAACDRAINLDRNYIHAWSNKGLALNSLGRHAEALVYFDQVIAIDAKFALGWCNKGLALTGLGRHMEAVAAFDRALELEPKHPHACSKAAALIYLGRYTDALAACDRAIELDAKCACAWSNKILALSSLGRHVEAMTAHKQAIKFCDAIPWLWVKSSWTNPALGQTGETFDDFRRAIDVSGSHPAALEVLAEAHVLHDNWTEAERVLTDRFRLPPSPSNPPKSWKLPDLIATIFRASTGRAVLAHRVARLAEIAEEAQKELEEAKSEEKPSQVPSPLGNAVVSVSARPLAVLGDSLVRSLTMTAYAEAREDALDTWASVWRDVAERYPDLSLAIRLFGVGVRYLQTKDERVLLDLVREERSILRDVFGLSGDREED